jgi:CBS domain-containing protein
MLVSEFMTRGVISLNENSTVEEAANLMIEKGFGGIPVVDSTFKLVGILTESDFLGKDKDLPNAAASLKRVLGQIYYSGDVEDIFIQSKNKSIREVMTGSPVTLHPGDSLSDAVNLITRSARKRIPVVENDKLVGIVTRHDIVRAYTMLKSERPHV